MYSIVLKEYTLRHCPKVFLYPPFRGSLGHIKPGHLGSIRDLLPPTSIWDIFGSFFSLSTSVDVLKIYCYTLKKHKCKVF